MSTTDSGVRLAAVWLCRPWNILQCNNWVSTIHTSRCATLLGVQSTQQYPPFAIARLFWVRWEIDRLNPPPGHHKLSSLKQQEPAYKAEAPWMHRKPSYNRWVVDWQSCRSCRNAGGRSCCSCCCYCCCCWMGVECVACCCCVVGVGGGACGIDYGWIWWHINLMLLLS
jgi:hypothetical protein